MIRTRIAAVTASTLVILFAGLAAGPAAGYSLTGRFPQAEARDASGRLTVEASVIHTVQCNSAGENGRAFYLYQYTKRLGFRAIVPPYWASPIGGRDFASFNEAASAACGSSRSTPPVAAAASLTGAWKSSQGYIYQFVQTGAQFTWHLAAINEHAKGAIQGDTVHADWGTNRGSGTISRDSSGRPVRIAWSNGVIMTR